jgi:periplasmic copper chaperone A
VKRLFVLIVLMQPLAVFAHAVFHPKEAESGSYHRAAIKIGHGCQGAATVKVIIDIPESVHLVKPMPKSGWQIEIVKETLAEPYDSHGKLIKEDVRQLIWHSGHLPDDYYDEFVFHMKLPTAVGKLYFPVRQICTEGENFWHEIPEGDFGHHGHHYSYPAPVLELIETSTTSR